MAVLELGRVGGNPDGASHGPTAHLSQRATAAASLGADRASGLLT